MQTSIFAIIGLVSMIVGLLLSLILPEIRLVAWGLIAFGVILVASAAIINFRRLRGAVTSRRGKFGASASIMVSIFAAIIVFVNAISVGVNHRFDFTALSQFTLTSQTKDVLAKIDRTINVLCFFVPTDDEYGTGAYATSLLIEYKNYSTKLQIKIIDPDQHPEEARKYGIQEYQSLVFETDLGRRLVSPAEIISQAEHAFTNAILEVTGIEQKTVYFLTGHGEASPSDTLSQLSDALQTNLLKVRTLDLSFTPSIPDDCATLIVAGPTKEMTDAERKIIADYLASNREALFLANPNSPDDITRLLAPWGVDVQNGTVIDPASYTTPNLDSPTIPRNRNYLGLTTVYFPGATAIIPQPQAPQGMEVIPLVWTTKDSWIDKNFDPTTSPQFDSTTEARAAYALGALIEPTVETDAQGNTTKVNEGPYIVAFGDSDFVTNNHFYNGNNSELLLTVVNALTSGTDVMSIQRRVFQTRRLIIGPEAATFLNISSIALLPALVLIIGAVIWWRRR